MSTRTRNVLLAVSAIVCGITVVTCVVRIIHIVSGDYIWTGLMMGSVDRLILRTLTISFDRRMDLLVSNGLAVALSFYAALAMSCAVVVARIAVLQSFPRISGAIALSILVIGGAVHLAYIGVKSRLGWYVVSLDCGECVFMAAWLTMMLVLFKTESREALT